MAHGRFTAVHLRLLAALLPAAACAIFFLMDPSASGARTPAAAKSDPEQARFALCHGRRRVTCVVDGDTFWYRGAKIRIADINAPEVSSPACASEADLGNRATGRLLVLLNAGPFTLAPNNDGTGRDHDRYGRRLRTVTRHGASLGRELVREGLAERWKGYRGTWC